MNTSMKGQKLLDAIEDAREFEAEVRRGWKKLTVYMPASLALAVVSFAVALAGPIFALTGTAIGVLCAAWSVLLFQVRTPRESNYAHSIFTHAVTIQTAVQRTRQAQRNFDVWVREGGVL